VQISNIIKGWLNVFKNITTEEHKRRANICKNCDSSIYSSYLDFINDELKEVKGMKCKECGCPLIAKIRSDSNCPLKKW